jgi:hypothetical protein
MKDIIDNITADLLLDHTQNRVYGYGADSEIDLDITVIVTECLWYPSDLLFEFDISIGLDEQIDSFSNLKKLSVTSRILGEL